MVTRRNQQTFRGRYMNTNSKHRWQPIETAPKEICSRDVTPFGPKDDPLIHEYGPYILAYPVFGRVAIVRWWQSNKDPRSCNFLEDGGNAARPSHWMPVP